MSLADWREYRKDYIGGSDIATILNMNPFRSSLSLYLEKTGFATEEIEENEAMYWGTTLEEVVAQEFAKRTGKKVRRSGFIYHSKEQPFAMANIDRMIVGEKSFLECKTTSQYNASKWENDEIPANYILQCQWYMYILGFEYCYVAVLIGGRHFIWKQLNRDQELIDMMVDAACDFWNNNVLAEVPPMIDGSSSATELLKRLYPQGNDGSTCELNEGAEYQIQKYLEAKEMISQWEQQKNEAENILKSTMGLFERGISKDHTVSWKTTVSNRVDTKQLKAKFPDVYQQVINATTSRRFTIK